VRTSLAQFDQAQTDQEWQQMFDRKKLIGVAALTALAAGTLASTSTFAAPTFDGLWSVSIVTTKGDCIASYRYPMLISKGVLANGGDMAIDVRGRVAESGAIKVTVSHGDQRAMGTGHLSGHAGGGSWRAASCSGSWSAQRRS
jgi:hypothetical protein